MSTQDPGKLDTILTVNDVASVLQVKPITVREMFREKRLRAFKVGKAWRTTQRMLQEYIEALARGESPAVLESDGPRVPPAAEAPREVAPASQVKPEKPAPKPPAPVKREPESAPAGEPSESSETDDADTQQLLF